MSVILFMVGVCTTETTFTRGWSPWKSELATKANWPSGVRLIVVGNSSTWARPTQRVARGIELPQGAERRAMRHGDVIALPVGRDRDVVRAVDIGGHDADRDDAIDGKAVADRPEPGGHVAGLAHHTDAVTRRRAVRGRERAPHSDRALCILRVERQEGR